MAYRAILRVITEPGATFASFSERVPIFPGYLAQMLAGVIGLILTLPVTMRVLEEQLMTNPTFTPEMLTVSKWSGIIGGAFGVLALPWLAGLIVALLAMFFGQFQEERVPFTSYLGMVGYARVPLVLGSLLSSVLVAFLGKQAATLNLSLAVLAPEGSSLMLKSFLGTFSPFGIWYYCVLAIAFGALHRGKATKGLGLVLTLYVISLAFTLGGAAIGSRFIPQM